MPSEKDKMLNFNQYMKSDKMPYIIYAGIESLIKKIAGCANNPESFSTKRLGELVPCRYSMITFWAFDSIEKTNILHIVEKIAWKCFGLL